MTLDRKQRGGDGVSAREVAFMLVVALLGVSFGLYELISGNPRSGATVIGLCGLAALGIGHYLYMMCRGR